MYSVLGMPAAIGACQGQAFNQHPQGMAGMAQNQPFLGRRLAELESARYLADLEVKKMNSMLSSRGIDIEKMEMNSDFNDWLKDWDK